jgi:hypothetical protein
VSGHLAALNVLGGPSINHILVDPLSCINISFPPTFVLLPLCVKAIHGSYGVSINKNGLLMNLPSPLPDTGSMEPSDRPKTFSAEYSAEYSASAAENKKSLV